MFLGILHGRYSSTWEGYILRTAPQFVDRDDDDDDDKHSVLTHQGHTGLWIGHTPTKESRSEAFVAVYMEYTMYIATLNV